MAPPAKATTSSKKPSPEYKALAAQFAAAERAKSAEEIRKEKEAIRVQDTQREALEARRKSSFEKRWVWNVGFWVWMLGIHVIGIGYFTSGFLLTRLMLDEKSVCDGPPTVTGSGGGGGEILPTWKGKGTVEGGCWHPRTFEKAVVVVIDALRYDFTVPVGDGAVFHDRFPFMYETARRSPQHAFLRPFIADPPTVTLQRLKGLTTGTLPTFVDVGSSFAGTAIEEDNLLGQLRGAGKRIVHLGDDTWDALFPGHFEEGLSRSYDSFNVWDLHTVDDGVVEHIFPLMDRGGEWDVVIGHLLGVDHAGHRYGPAHEEMGRKLEQMDGFVRELAGRIDENTVLIVMGDHGMDGKGDHGGESDDEVEAALWMYSKRPMFGRTKGEYVTPPATAKVRPVNQIDFVPTLAMMLGIPIPYNNLGRPIEEVFIGPSGTGWENLAAAERTAAAGIRRYQGSYFEARGIVQAATPGSPAELWDKAEGLVSAGGKGKEKWAAVFEAFAAYQGETLKRCKSLWASFDMKKMAMGIAIMALGVVSLLTYVSKGVEDDDEAILENPELDLAEKKLEMQGVKPASETVPGGDLDKSLVGGALMGFLPVFLGGVLQSYLSGVGDWYRGAGFGALTSIVMVLVVLFDSLDVVLNLVPTTFWGWLAVVFTVSQSVGFASNSFTIWEDSILLFFIATFGFASALSALKLTNTAERYLSVYNSIMFVILGRLASFSKLCREEQMPYCTSTYYASATSSTSATWQLVIPFLVFLILPSIIKAYLVPSRSYEGLAPAWIGYVFRTGLFMAALYWVLDAADNGNWFPSLPANTLKSISVYLAQTILGLSLVAGTTAFVWAPPCVSIYTAARQPGQAQVTVLGYGNAHGSRYLLLPLNILAACFLLSKPMGGGALGLMMWQILALVEILDYNSLTSEAIGPIMLAMLGNFYFFKTGHQAVLSTIQWDSAFIPLFSIRYPWSPIVVAFNTFGGQILAVAAVPLLVLWKVGPSRKGLLTKLSRSFGIFMGYFAVEALASMMWAGHLRRHLMLYRVFCPRFMTAAVVLVVVDVFGLLVGLAGFRCNSLAVGEVFGWAE